MGSRITIRLLVLVVACLILTLGVGRTEENEPLGQKDLLLELSTRESSQNLTCETFNKYQWSSFGFANRNSAELCMFFMGGVDQDTSALYPYICEDGLASLENECQQKPQQPLLTAMRRARERMKKRLEEPVMQQFLD